MRRRAHLAALVGLVFQVACSSAPRSEPAPDAASPFIAAMDARPAAEQPPRWQETRALMMRPAPRQGEMAPDCVLARESDGQPISLSALWQERPVVLVFGSYT